MFINTGIHRCGKVTMSTCPFLQWRIFRLLLICPHCSGNAIMHSCREKTKRQILCNVMVADRPGLNNATVWTWASYLTSLNFNFPQNRHNASFIQLWRGLNRSPSGKHPTQGLIVNQCALFFMTLEGHDCDPRTRTIGKGTLGSLCSSFPSPLNYLLNSGRFRICKLKYSGEKWHVFCNLLQNEPGKKYIYMSRWHKYGKY